MLSLTATRLESRTRVTSRHKTEVRYWRREGFAAAPKAPRPRNFQQRIDEKNRPAPGRSSNQKATLYKG